MNYENKLVDAIQLIVDNAVSNANFDKTVQGKIIECTDATIGKYKVQYQDSVFYAYSASIDTAYSKDADVYILIPGNDTRQEKTILGTTKKLGSDFINNENKDFGYELIGNNCIKNTQEFQLCSYRSEKIDIYVKDSEENLIDIDIKGLETYIYNSSSLLCGAEIKTSLPIEQQFRGNYGIIFELCFLDNASQELVYRNYVVDVNQIQGNPYKLQTFRRQYGIFEIDSPNFQYINKISLFVYDFPHSADNKPVDIFIKNLEINGCIASDSELLNGCDLTILTPNGTYFDENNTNEDSKLIEAHVRVKGKEIDVNSQELSYFWFVENVGILTNSDKYNNYGGQGWECLNSFNIITEKDNNENIVEWVPSSYQFNVFKKDVPAKETKFKCVALYNESILSKEFTIINYSSAFDISIESDSGTDFFYDIGNPSLKCLINGELKTDENFNYIWGKTDISNNFTNLPETVEENDEYNNAVEQYNLIKTKIENEEIFENEAAADLEQYLTIIEKYNKIMRIEKNKIHHLQIKDIETFNIFKCSVFYNGVFIGSNSIQINNSLENKDGYNLVINNGTQVFKYDELGVSSTNESLVDNVSTKPLSFTIFDNNGLALEEEVLKNCEIEWIVPNENTLIEIITDENKPDEVDLINKKDIYKNRFILNYRIASRYDINKNNNDIILQIKYKNMNLLTQTNFTFVKEGEPGTNGTEFVCKIVPNCAENNFNEIPMILNGELNFTPKSANIWFNVQLWHSGNKIFESNTTGLTTENKNAIILWEILKNKYSISIEDNSDIQIDDAQKGIFSYLGYHENSTPCNIIKCSVIYDNITYYATLPIITGETNESFKVKLKKDTGFQYALYTSDGRSPQYNNNNPFELEVLENINGIEENISEKTKEHAVNYEWTILGKIYDPIEKEWIESIHLGKSLLLQNELKRNQASFKPIDNFNGECLNVGLECKLTDINENTIGYIHIPIHLLLNKYGNAAINDWDGNHVSIDENGSGVILAPQIGAGKKETDNSFTGTLMGQVKEAGKSHTDIGFFGYNHGSRTLFLNSEDGSAIFGKAGNGQIIIDPTTNKALLYSSNYWKNYDVDGKPNNYSSGNENGQGMLIDLTTPQIKWGNENFIINEEGHITAKGGGDIAGWLIDNYKLYKEKTGMSSVDDVLAEGVTKAEIKVPYATSDDTGYATDTKAIAFWAGKDKFFVSHDGYLKAVEASIGSGSNPIFIGKSSGNNSYSALWSGKKSSFNADASGFYIGTDGIALGSLNDGKSKFQVDNNGHLISRDAEIGGWSIDRYTLKAGNVTFNSNGNLSGTNWYINNDGSCKFGNLTISSNGNITANGGTFNNIYANGGTFTNINVTGSASLPASCITGLIQSNQIGSVNAGTITTGTMSANRISGGTLNIATGGGGYVRAGVSTTHLDVSGINVGSAGANFGGKGLSLQNGTTWNFSGGNGDFGSGNIYCGDLIAKRSVSCSTLTIGDGGVSINGNPGFNGKLETTFDPGAGLDTHTLYFYFRHGICTNAKVIT